jgi:Ser/Thr protein kinase RdoA (MazF antagonist)
LRAHGLSVPRAAGAPWHGPDGLVATIWEWIEPIDRPVDWSEVGSQVRRLHDLDPVDVVPDGHPCPRPDRFPWWDFDTMLAGVSELLDAEARRGIERVCERHASWRSTLGDGAVLCHGDVHPGNVLATADGVVLLDWDLLCRAPRAWDLGALATLHERWGGDPTVLVEFTRGYGEDLTLDPRATAYAELRLVAATLLRLRAGRHDPAAAAEAARRLRWWRGDPDAPIWVAQ